MKKNNIDKEFESAKEYFEILKSKKQKIDSVKLDSIYDNCLTLLNKYTITGQVDALKKLIFHIESLEAERKVLSLGIDTFVYLSDIKEYIGKVPGRVVKIIELHRYEREVPDEIVQSIEKIKNIFTELFVVFTDYTGDHEKKHKKETDPILFGMFKDKNSASVVERMYYIGDWEDEYCDLTFDKLIAEMKSCSNINIEHKIKLPQDIEELKSQLKNLKRNERFEDSNEEAEYLIRATEKKSFFKKIKSFINSNKHG